MILGYCRVSTGKQAGPDKTSLEDQENKIRGYAMANGADRFGLQFYIDAGESGALTLERRTEGQNLLRDVRPGDTVVAAKLDRLFRNAVDALTLAERWHNEGVKLVLYDISPEPVYESPVAKLFFSVLAAMAAFERERIHERIKQGKEGKRARGGHVGGIAPFGFAIEGSGSQSRLVPKAEEQATARLIRARAKDGETASDIARYLNRNRITTRSGQPWQFIQVQRILNQGLQ